MQIMLYPRPRAWADVTIVGGLLAAGLIHLILTPQHLNASPILGLGFVGVALLQISLALLFSRQRSSNWLPVALIVVVASLCMYAVSRTIGLSFGHTHSAQPGILELGCKSAELVTAAVLSARIGKQRAAQPSLIARQPLARWASYPLALSALGIVLALVLVVLGSQLAALQAQPAADHHYSATHSTSHQH